mgnify:CR=1 FL=1
MSRITNSEISHHVAHLEPFSNKHDSVFANDDDTKYVVYSYGDHFPMAMFDKDVGKWIVNEDKYSRTTSKHQSLVKQGIHHVDLWLTNDHMQLAVHKGYRKFIADHINFATNTLNVRRNVA